MGMRRIPNHDIFFIFVLPIIAGCQTLPKTSSSEPYVTSTKEASRNIIDIPMLHSKLIAKQITFVGINSKGRFSPTGQKISFVSQNRPSHLNSQIYELDLQKNTENRLTYNDGDSDDPVYSEDGIRLLFASTTDEIKDEKNYLQRMKKNFLRDTQDDPEKNGTLIPESTAEKAQATKLFPPMEVYEFQLNTRTITRLTEHEGFDGEPTFGSKKGHVVVVSVEDGHPAMYSIIKRNRKKISSSDWSDEYPRYSVQQKAWVWQRQKTDPNPNPETDIETLYIADSNFESAAPLLKNPKGEVHPAWNQKLNEVIFSSKRNSEFYNLYAYNRDQNCLRRLTNSEANHDFPDVSPDGEWLSFSSEISGKNQIYLMSYPSDQPCLPEGENPSQ